MTITLDQPGREPLHEAVRVLRGWQHDGAPMQLHPGDVGWYWRFGTEAVAAAVRTWRRHGHVVAVGLLDGPRLLRLTVAPDARQDDALARRLAADVARPERGVLPSGTVLVEAPADARLQEVLAGAGWDVDEPWTPLRRDLTGPVEDAGVRVEVVGPAEADVRAAVQRAAFDGSSFTADRWRAMAAAPPYTDARCLVAFDDAGNAVAVATVWSAGAGRPGLLEPLGVHRDHRGRGHGRAMTLAAARTLRALGASSAVVCTPSANVAAVATYRAAGFVSGAEVRDRRRDAGGPAASDLHAP